MPFLAVCACNPRAGEVVMGDAFWAGYLAEAVNPRSNETLTQKKWRRVDGDVLTSASGRHVCPCE